MKPMQKIMSGTAIALAIGAAPLAAMAETSVPKAETTAPAQPQAESQAQAPAQMEGEANEVSNEKLDSFVAAMMEVAEVRQTYEPRLQQAETDQERQEIAEEGNSAIRDRVNEVEGITFEEFATIAGAAGTDPALGARIEERLAALQTE